MTETKPTNGLLTDRLNSTDQKTDNLTNNIDGSKPTNDEFAFWSRVEGN